MKHGVDNPAPQPPCEIAFGMMMIPVAKSLGEIEVGQPAASGLELRSDLGRLIGLLEARLELEIDVVDVFEALHQGDGVVVVDARSPWARRLGSIPGAIAPSATLGEDLACTGSVVVCGSGEHRLDAVRIVVELAKSGIAAKVLRGGFSAWVAEGFPVDVEPAARSVI